ncbi:hypothetical protein BDV06DRAFT_182062 [Aspergillus oleicola]
MNHALRKSVGKMSSSTTLLETTLALPTKVGECDSQVQVDWRSRTMPNASSNRSPGVQKNKNKLASAIGQWGQRLAR